MARTPAQLAPIASKRGVVFPDSTRYDEVVRLLARYGGADELATDVRDQLPRGGMVVRTPVPAGLQLFSPVEVAVECDGRAIVVAGQVLQIFPGVGVAVGLDRPARSRIEDLVGVRSLPAPMTPPAGTASLAAAAAAAVTAAGAGEMADVDVEAVARMARGTVKPTDGQAPMTAGPADADPGAARELARGSSPSIDRISLALRGDRDQRMEILRGRNRTLHVYVLRNPALTLDEICAIARMPTVSPDVLVQIAERREWGQRPEVAMSLVRNPTTPVPVAIKLLDHVSLTELRLLAKDARTREPIQRAARKKLLS